MQELKSVSLQSEQEEQHGDRTSHGEVVRAAELSAQRDNCGKWQNKETQTSPAFL